MDPLSMYTKVPPIACFSCGQLQCYILQVMRYKYTLYVYLYLFYPIILFILYTNFCFDVTQRIGVHELLLFLRKIYSTSFF